MTNKLFKIDETEADSRLDTYLADMYENLSRTQIQNFIKSNKVMSNGKTCKPSYILRIDDEIECCFSEDENKILPENTEIDIVYETDNYSIINKPSGMLTHPTSKEKTGTLVNALLFKYGNDLSDINGDYRRGIVHRLDRNTSGLLVIAKNNNAHEKFAQMIKDRTIEKRYRAIVKGRIENDFIIDEPIGRSKSHPNKMCVTKDGKESLTEIKIVELFDEATYLDVNLKTGRTHQIRVHLSHAGHPVFNDTLYGFGKMKIKTEEQVLQSYSLSFTDPFDNKEVSIQIEPDDKIKKVLYYLRQRGEK